MSTTAASKRSRRPAVMTTAAATTTVDQYDHVAAASYLMKHARASALPVLDSRHSNQPIGSITQADIAEAMAHGMDPEETRIRDLIVPSHGRSA